MSFKKDNNLTIEAQDTTDLDPRFLRVNEDWKEPEDQDGEGEQQ